MADPADALTSSREGTVLLLDVNPKAKADRFPAGYNEWRHAIGCSITAPPVEGKANRAIVALLSRTLTIPQSGISILTGATSSQKRVLIQGMTFEQLAEFLRERCPR
jgi:uncharacterized protein (TIGR00251 family)